MKTSFKKNQVRFGKLFGIPLTVDYSWFLVLFFITWILAGSYFPTEYKGWSHFYYWAIGGITSILFFVSVLLHEIGHSVVAKRFDYNVKQIKLFIFGGISEIGEEPRNPKEEFLISVAGPVVTFLLAGFFYGLADLAKGNEYLYALFHYLGLINLFLGVFNILPGFPLDGGRILRAIIWARTKDFDKANKFAAGVGRIFGFFVIMIGFFEMMAGFFFDGLWLSFIGWFLESAAFAQIQKEQLSKYFAGHTVEEALTKSYGLVPSDTTIAEFIQDEILTRHRRAFVVEEAGKYLGLLTIHDIKNIPQTEWDNTNVTEIMKPLSEVKRVDINFPLSDALKEMDKEGVNQMPVFEGDKIVGMLSRESIISFLTNLNLSER
ncbi:MAG: site-2 protease family protein [Chlorobi bacterium]|nr:site-2 protease family protein [Chlorobiota bacterium]